jgi:hypothetical protein
MDHVGVVAVKARAEVENVVDEVVLSIQNGVTHADGSDGFDPEQAEVLRDRLREFAGRVMRAARGEPEVDIYGSIDAVVETIGRGVVPPTAESGFEAREADELRSHLGRFATALVAAARDGSRLEVDAAIVEVVRTIRRGLFFVYGRASYAAISADQLEAYLETFVDAALTVVEKEGAVQSAPGS